MNVDAAFQGGRRQKFTVPPGEVRRFELLIGCVKSMSAIKSVDIEYDTASKLLDRARQSGEATVLSQPPQVQEPRQNPPSSSKNSLSARSDVESKTKTVVRQTGTVKFYDAQKGYGFLKSDDGGTDIYVHFSAVDRSGIGPLVKGMRVSFETEANERGNGSRAVNLQHLSAKGAQDSQPAGAHPATAKRESPVASPTVPISPRIESDKDTRKTAVAGTPEDDWNVCNNPAAWNAAFQACTRLIERGDAIANPRRAAAHLKRAELNERVLSLSKPDATVQAKIIADYGESLRLDPEQPLVFLARAALAVRMGDRRRALADYDEVLRLDPSNAEAYRGRGGSRLANDDVDPAIDDLSRSLELAPDSVTYEMRARAYEKKNNLRAAFADLDSAFARKPKNSLSADVIRAERDRIGGPLAREKVESGQSALQNGQIDRAFTDFDEALRFDRGNWRANFNRGRIYLQRGQFDKAGTDLSTAIQQFARAKPSDLPPELATAHALLGEVYEKTARLRDALVEYDKALKMEPALLRAADVRASRARVAETAWRQCADSERRQAAQVCGTFLAMGNAVDAALRAKAFLYSGRSEQLDTTGDPRDAFDSAIRLDNKQSLAFFGRGQSNAVRGALDRALADLTEAIRLDPKFAPAFYARGFVHEKRGDLDRALEDLSQAIKLGNLMEAYSLRAEIYQRRGDASRFGADLAAALEASKSQTGQIDVAEPLACLGRAQFGVVQGKFDEANQWLHQAMRRDLKNALAYLGRGAVYAKQDRIDDAVRELSNAIRFGNLEAAYALRGQLFEKKGDMNRALADYDAVLAGTTNVANAEGIRTRVDRIRSQKK
jgi:tetratricopeptide (TPR) repeat protein